MARGTEEKQNIVVEHREEVPHGEEGVVGFVAEQDELPKGNLHWRNRFQSARELT